jgi:hypothetical protein
MDKVICYLGPSLPLANAKAILPEAIYLPPARQADIVSDIGRFNPTHILLGDGQFNQNLSVWHKELVYALQYPGVKGVYGFSSIGAIRAAELDFLGMVGIGEIYRWYRDGITEDDAEIAVSYAENKGIYHVNNIPLCDIRAGVEQLGEADKELGHEFLEAMRQVPYQERSQEVCERSWQGLNFPRIPQKQLDAEEALRTFRDRKPEPLRKPTPEDLSPAFSALYERDRRININGVAVAQQHLDAHVLLHQPEWERICWDSSNQELALILCNMLCVTVSLEEVEAESRRFQRRAEIETPEDFECFLENNGWNRPEFNRLMIANARIRKLQHHHTVSKVYKRNTQAILDYLRTQQGFDFWAIQAAQREAALANDDWLQLDIEVPAFARLIAHMDAEGLDLKITPEDYLLETGFSNLKELSVALQRTAVGKE